MTTKKLSSLAVAIAAFAVACADPTTPNRPLPGTVSQAVIPHPIDFNAGGTLPAGVSFGTIRLCKTADAAGSFDFTVTTAGTGTLPDATPTIVVGAGGGTVCANVYTSTVTNAGVEQVVITEAADQTNWSLTGINVDQYFGANVVYPAPRLADLDNAPARGVTLFINNDMAKVATFTNDFTPPPVVGTEGCTPGYWKQDQHADSWPAGFAPGDDFDTVFGDDWFATDITLLEALQLGGGGKNALARHAVAALLNAASGGVDSPMTPAEVIAAVQAAFDAQGTIESTKNTLAANNELGCPLN